MNTNKTNMYQILNGNKQFIVPIYQRYYSWERAQCKRLWEDILKIIKENKDMHFLGCIVNIVHQAGITITQQYMIIDGQQRITTMLLLLIALRDFLIKSNNQKINVAVINDSLLKNLHQEGNQKYKLLLTKSDKNTLINLIEQKVEEKEHSSKLIENYNFFLEQITNSKIDIIEIFNSVSKLQIIDITLEPPLDDAQAIFESLNSTGKDLSEADLIRNYVLMDLDHQEQSNIYENIWYPLEQLFPYAKQEFWMDRFFRDYLTMKLGRIPNINKIYEEFKNYKKQDQEFSSIEDLCKDLFKFANYYTKIVFINNKDKELNKICEDMRHLKMDIVNPLLLKIYDDYYQKSWLSELELKEIMHLCVNYVFRRAICDLPTNSLNKTFANLAKEIDVNHYLNSFKAALILKDGYRAFPKDDSFIKNFVEKDIYNMRARNYILATLENFNNKGPITINNYTIEHIMPQNKNLNHKWIAALGPNWQDIQKEYLHTIGNITLTAYNSEMGDLSFLEKLEKSPGGFKESGLRLNSYVARQNTWNQEHIQKRAQELSLKALIIWHYPQLSEKELAPYKVKKTSNYDLNSYDFNDHTKKLYEALNRAILNLSPDLKYEYRKLYITYRLDYSIANIIVQKKRLKIIVNMKFADVIDQNHICQDVANLGEWGNGEVKVVFENITKIDQVMEIIEQAYNLQIE